MEFEAPEPLELRKTGHHMVDMVTSICALGISTISIFMAYQNGHDMEKLVHANSWPAIQLGSGNDNEAHEKELSFELQNAGVGPARIHSFEFLVDGRAVQGQYLVAGIVQACCADSLKKAQMQSPGTLRDALGGDYTRPIASSFISPRQEATALRWPRTDKNQELWQQVDAARQHGRITMRACYCSVFDECWVAESKLFPPRPVRSCGKPPTSR